MRVWNVVLLCSILLASVSVAIAAQRAGAFGASRDHLAISYSSAPVSDAVSLMKRKIDDGSLTLSFDPTSGYLRSVLQALDIPIESQVLVYSETSFQARRINRKNPRAIFFNDHVSVGWVRGGEVLEFSAQDPQQGTIYYTLSQRQDAPGPITRSDNCLSCHLSWETLAVPGPFVLTSFPRKSADEYVNGFHVDHRAPLAERWSGWFVTGTRVPRVQLGNVELLQPNMPESGPVPVVAKKSLDGEFDLTGYPTPFSDVVALLVLEHQGRATNLITRAGWEYRQAVYDAGAVSAAAASPRVREAVDELVDYFLFVDEAPLPTPVRGSSGFAEQFAAAGPRDAKGRSLRELQLDTRLMRYPCSYMIYSPGFDGLPGVVKSAIYRRLNEVLSAATPAKKYAHLTREDRQTILTILRETKPDFSLDRASRLQ